MSSSTRLDSRFAPSSTAGPMLFRRAFLPALFVIALLAHFIVFLDAGLSSVPLVWQAAAILVWTGLLPGWLTVEWLTGGQVDTIPEPGEKLLYSIGCGFGWIVLGMLLLSYLPGPLLWQHTLIAYDALLLLLGAGLWFRHRHNNPVTLSRQSPIQAGLQTPPLSRTWLFLALVSLALVGAGLRLPNLDYSEFQGDEARAILRAVQMLQGDSGAILGHQKGPGEILTPAVVYSLTGRINEAAARLPFTLAGITGIFALFLLGRRMFHPIAGWSAAMLLALDGYLIGFARIVQYQSLVFLMGVLVLLVLYRLVQHPQEPARYLTLAAIFLATGLLAHYETALVVFPGLFLLGVLWQRGMTPGRLARALVAPLCVGGAILALFYVPFVLNPAFGATYAYIAESRIGGAFPYNNLQDMFTRSTLYSTSYYIGLLTLCATAGLSAAYRRNLPHKWGWVAIGLLWGGLLLTILQPGLLVVGETDFTWAFFVLAIAPVWFLPRLSVEERTAWLWFGGPLIFMLFFTRTPNTHVYGFFIPWTLVAGMVIARFWQAIVPRIGINLARAIAIPAAVLLLLLFGNYAYRYFTASPWEVLHTWRDNRPAGYWVPYTMPDRASFSSFGFPMRNGWKAIGALYDQGILSAPFTTNDRQAVADWYTRGLAYCPRDHRHFILSYPVEPGEQTSIAQLRAELQAEGYRQSGVVLVNHNEKIEIYDLGLPPAGVQSAPDEPAQPLRRNHFDLDDFIAYFDRQLSGPTLEPNGPTAAPQIEHSLAYRFGEHIWLDGYRIDRTHLTEDETTGETAGDTMGDTMGEAVRLTLYWRATQPVPDAYSVFTQIIRMDDFHKIGQQDGEPGCDLFPTTTWTPQTVITDRYYIPIDEMAPPGNYSLLIGMYLPESSDRLPIFGADGSFISDSLILTEITVE